MRNSNLVEIYNKEYFDRHRGKAGYKPSVITFIKAVLSYNPKKILDVGCGHGHLVKTLLEDGYDVYGLDFSTFAGELVPKDRFILADAMNIPFSDKKFDVVCSKGVLEHIPEEELDQACSELQRVGKHVVAEVCTKIKYKDGHITIHPQEWWNKRYPNIQFISRCKYNI